MRRNGWIWQVLVPVTLTMSVACFYAGMRWGDGVGRARAMEGTMRARPLAEAEAESARWNQAYGPGELEWVRKELACPGARVAPEVPGRLMATIGQLEREAAALRARERTGCPPGPARTSYERLQARVRHLEALLAAQGIATENDAGGRR